MNMEAQQLLRDPEQRPTDNLIADCLGAASEVYKEFLEALTRHDISLMDWRYYNDGKAWLSKGEYRWTTARGTNKVVPLFWLSIWHGFFKITFNFAETSKDGLLSLPISEDTKEMIMATEAKGNKMKHVSVIFDVDNGKAIHDILLLSEFRKKGI